MNTQMMRRLLTLCIVLVIFVMPSRAKGPYEIPWYTIDGGGGTSSGGPYTLTGTIGQPDADWSRAGDYEVLGGFWPGGPLCFVEFGDFAIFADLWLMADLTADLDNDADLDFADLQYLTDYWLLYCPYGWPLR